MGVMFGKPNMTSEQTKEAAQHQTNASGSDTAAVSKEGEKELIDARVGTASTPSDKPQLESDDAPLSKNARKKRARQEQWEAYKRRRKENERQERKKRTLEKRRERDDRLRAMSEEERKAEEEGRREKLLAFRAEQRNERKRVHDTLAEANKDSVGKGYVEVCIDLGWNNKMSDKERKSLCRQLMYSYNSLRKCILEGRTPVRLTICGVDDSIKPNMNITANGWGLWPIPVSEKSLSDYYAEGKRKIVYLTHDAEQVLDELSDDEVYVIGGIVDRNRLKGATMKKAEQLNVRAARLNIDTNIDIKHGTRVLTVNHCVDILIYRANGMSWADAYMKVLPERKGLQTKNSQPAKDKDEKPSDADNNANKSNLTASCDQKTPLESESVGRSTHDEKSCSKNIDGDKNGRVLPDKTTSTKLDQASDPITPGKNECVKDTDVNKDDVTLASETTLVKREQTLTVHTLNSCTGDVERT